MASGVREVEVRRVLLEALCDAGLAEAEAEAELASALRASDLEQLPEVPQVARWTREHLVVRLIARRGAAAAAAFTERVAPALWALEAIARARN